MSHPFSSSLGGNRSDSSVLGRGSDLDDWFSVSRPPSSGASVRLWVRLGEGSSHLCSTPNPSTVRGQLFGTKELPEEKASLGDLDRINQDCAEDLFCP